MSTCDDFINVLRKTLPDLCITKDLVKIGIYRSDQAAYHARKTGNSPAYFRLPHRGIVYPKKGVIDFLEKGKHEGLEEKPKEKFVRKYK